MKYELSKDRHSFTHSCSQDNEEGEREREKERKRESGTRKKQERVRPNAFSPRKVYKHTGKRQVKPSGRKH